MVKGLEELNDKNRELFGSLIEGTSLLSGQETMARSLGNELKFTAGALDSFRENLKEFTEELDEEDINRIDAAKIAFGNFFKDLGSSLSESFLQGWERFTGGIAFLGEKFREITGLPTIAEALELDEADQDVIKFDQLRRKLEDANPLEAIAEGLTGPLAGRFNEEFEKNFGEGGVLGLLQQFQAVSYTHLRAHET